ncbi:MAG: family 10 glycosylhydrolase, partial [Akkermansiaceae bacterium]
MIVFRILYCFVLLPGLVFGKEYRTSSEKVPMVPREFRAAWVACVYNIDWPSKPGLATARQQAEMRALLDRMAAMRMNAVIFQVRPNADAVYQSRLEPWSHWIS